MQELVEYIIEDKGSYNDNIGFIMEKNQSKKWISQIALQQIQISLRLKKSSYISKVEIRGNQTQVIEITFKDIDKEIIETKTFDLKSSKDQTVNRNIEHSRMTAYIDVKLRSSDGKPQVMGLNYLIFKGQNNPLKPTKEKITNFTKQQSIDNVKLDSIRPPIKSKPAEISRPYKNLAKPFNNIFQQRQKRNQNQRSKPSNREEDEIQKAIKQSERTYNQQQKIKQSKEFHNEIEIDKDQSDTIPLAPIRKYQVDSYEQLAKSMEHLSSRYFQAHKAIEMQLGVSEQQRLSNFIQVKHLLNRQIFIDQDSIKGQRKSKLQNIADKLGAKIIASPKNYCILISTSWDNPSVKNAVNKFTGVKAVNEDYLIDCKKHNAELNWKDYSLKK